MLGFSQKGAGFSRRRAANSIIIGAKIYEEGKRGEGRKGGNTSEEREEVEGGGLVAISWYYLHLPWSALAVTDALYLISGHTAGYIGTSIPVYISPFRR